MTGNSEPWGRLTRQEVYDCFPTGTLPAGLRTWAQLRPAIRRLPMEAQTHLRQVTEAKEHVSKQNKRDADARAQAKRQAAWREQRKVDQPASEDSFRSAQFSGKYLSLPTEEESRNRVAAFIDSTGNEALARCVCIVCARELLRGEGQ